MVEFKAAATSRPRTRQSEDLETEEQLGYEPGKIYVILADTRDYSEGFCLAKCVKPNVDSFLGNYLEKSVVAGTDVLFNVTSYRANFEAETVRYSPGSVPRVKYRAQFMNKILYFHKKLNVFHLA